MVNYTELMIGDWIQIDGIPRQVQAITKEKVGYYILDCTMYYAKLNECEYLPIKSIEFKGENLIINHNIIIELNRNIHLTQEMFEEHTGYGTPKISIRYWIENIIGEKLLANVEYVHKFHKYVKILLEKFAN